MSRERTLHPSRWALVLPACLALLLVGGGAGCARQKPPATPDDEDDAPPPAAATSPKHPHDKADDPSVEIVAPLIVAWSTLGTGAADPKLGQPTSFHAHLPTGTCMPEGLGPFVLKNVVDNGDDDRGVSLVSPGDGIILSFFTYPAPRSLKAEIEGIAGLMCKGATSMSTNVSDPRFPDPGVIAACGHATRNGQAIEQALVFKRGDWFYEARFSFFGGSMIAKYSLAMSVVQTAFRPCPK